MSKKPLPEPKPLPSPVAPAPAPKKPSPAPPPKPAAPAALLTEGSHTVALCRASLNALVGNAEEPKPVSPPTHSKTAASPAPAAAAPSHAKLSDKEKSGSEREDEVPAAESKVRAPQLRPRVC